MSATSNQPLQQTPNTNPTTLQKVTKELGIHTVIHSPLDVKLLLLSRFIRLFAYGQTTLILALYFKALDISDARIGLFMSLTLVGDVFISLILTLIADSVGRRLMLSIGAVMMAGSGVVFANFGGYWVLLAAAVVGVISPSGNEIGPFRAVEESTLAHLIDESVRTDIFSWHVILGTLGISLGNFSCGWIVESLQHKHGWSRVEAYRIIFWIYAGVGILKLILSLLMSSKCEADDFNKQKTFKKNNKTKTAPLRGNGEGASSEETPLIAEQAGNADAVDNKDSKGKWSIFPKISKKSRGVLIKLCLLFAVDSLASGLVPGSWITYFFAQKFQMPEGSLGTLFLVTSLVASFGNLMASSIARRIGLVQTMVFTHLPSAIFLALIPVPSNLILAMTFLVLRSSLSSMDQAPRSAFLSAIVLPSERTAVMGVVNVVKTSSQSSGPLITGLLAGRGVFWVAFLVAGSLKASYDLGMLAMFTGENGARKKKVVQTVEGGGNDSNTTERNENRA